MEYSGAGGKLIHEKNQKQKISWHCPFNFHIHVSVSDLYIPRIGHRYMNVGIGNEAALFHFLKYINRNQTFILGSYRPFICSVRRLHRLSESISWNQSLGSLNVYKSTSGVVDTDGNLPEVSLTPAANLLPVSLTRMANLPPVSTTTVVPVAKFTAGVIDTGGKIATGAVDAGGASWRVKYLRNCLKISEMT